MGGVLAALQSKIINHTCLSDVFVCFAKGGGSGCLAKQNHKQLLLFCCAERDTFVVSSRAERERFFSVFTWSAGDLFVFARSAKENFEFLRGARSRLFMTKR